MDDKEKTELWQDIMTAARKAAYKVCGGGFGGKTQLDVEDVTNGVLLGLVERPGSVEKLVNGGVGNWSKFLERMATQVVSKELDDYAEFHGQCRYDREEVRNALLTGHKWDRTKFQATLVDLEICLTRMQGSSYHDLLSHIYQSGDWNKGQEKGSQQVKLSRAIEALTLEMNRKRVDEEADWDLGGRARPKSGPFQDSLGDEQQDWVH